MVGSPDGRTRYREVFASAEYRALFAAHTVSTVGDQFARVALTVLVFRDTGSPAWAAITYALTFLPDLIGGPLLSGLADRYPRRAVMICSDLLRAALVALMAVPALPWPVVCGLLVLVQLAGAPAVPARTALLPHILPGPAFRAGAAALSTVSQAAQVAGFAAGGVLVVAVGTGGVLLIDAASFAASAAAVAWWVTPRPTPGDPAGARPGWWRAVTSGAVLVWRDRRLLALICFASLSAFYICGEALAVPLADRLGGGPVAAGLLFAAYPAGCALASLFVATRPERTQLRALPVLAVATSAPLIACALNPELPVLVLLFVVSGAASAYHAIASPTFALWTPDHARGQVYGLAVTALKIAQGLGVAAAGIAAEHASPHYVLAAGGVLGVLAALGVGVLWRRSGALDEGRPVTS
ncbi:putative MFS family arabinose efflux permease [Saccharothrix carnea]|uniref:Putative MFS family arabinose efflux permease n=1 Tax=Saccharothrix carnea TaxID=1280637 RepID=A0A2P8HR43_SACCR|nr:MFS transporter [Saccharothrix carnea]PSL48654.1 putative MFS family arabinose efflux permease [Saccharothrix carnea]